MFDVELEMEVPDFPDMGMGGVIDSYTKKQADEKFQEKLSEEQIKNINDVKNKVTKEDGKGLSTNDYTTEEKQDVAKIVEKADVSYVKNTFANALKGSANGQSVNLTNVSPVEHTLDVRVKSKNVAYNVRYLDAEPGKAAVTGYFDVEEGKIYTISFDTENTGITLWSTVNYGGRGEYLENKTLKANGERQFVSFKALKTGQFSGTLVQASTAATTTSGLCSNYMIECGTEATEYTPYMADVSGVSVKKYGKNLFDPKEVVNRTTHGITTTVQEDGGIAFSGVATAIYRYFTPNFFKNQILLSPGTYTLSGHDRLTIQVKYLDGTSENFVRTFTLKKYGFLKDALLNNLTVGDEYNMTIYPSLIVGSVAEYEPYKEPVTYNVNADGTVEGVTSIYPATTLITDTGAVVDVTYNKDINKAFLESQNRIAELEEKLTNAIISLGGNV